MYYPCSENKGGDQLRGYREADLRLCFRIGKNPVLSRCGSYYITYPRCKEEKEMQLNNKIYNRKTNPTQTNYGTRSSKACSKHANIRMSSAVCNNIMYWMLQPIFLSHLLATALLVGLPNWLLSCYIQLWLAVCFLSLRKQAHAIYRECFQH